MFGNGAVGYRSSAHSWLATTPGRTPAKSHLDTAVARIRDACPDAVISLSGRGLRVAAAGVGGFPVVLEQVDGTTTVWFQDCHYEIPDINDAIAWAIRALSAASRLRIDYVGAQVRSWSLEIKTPDGAWQSALSGGYGMMPSWQKRRTLYLQNDLVVAGRDLRRHDLRLLAHVGSRH